MYRSLVPLSLVAGEPGLQSTTVESFYETLDYCFDSALRDILGDSVRKSIYDLLGKHGVRRSEISSRFDDTVGLMMKLLGSCSKVIVQRTVLEMYRQYSQRITFSYADSLRDQLRLLKESVVANHLAPRRLWENANLDTLQIPARTDPHPNSPETLSWQ